MAKKVNKQLSTRKSPRRLTKEEGLPLVAILATGGTIAGTGATGDQLTGYTAGVLSASDLLAAVPEITRHARIHSEQVANVDSSQMRVAIWLQLAKRINELLASDVAGVVVTHGTDTMEETAYFLQLTVHSPKPVVLVGAMRPATAISADGPLNLLAAVIIAASQEAIGQGVLVAMDGDICGARSVTKTNTMRVGSFKSPDVGCLGYLVENRPVFYHAETRRHTFDSEFNLDGLKILPKVEIVYSYADAGPEAAMGVLAGNPAGIVSGGVGDGLLAAAVEKVLRQAARKGVVVVRSSRVGSGVTSHSANDGRNRFITADSLTPVKARILLMLALTRTDDRVYIQRLFSTY
jgi:L-asparaginase type II